MKFGALAVVDADGDISVEALAKALRITKSELALAVGLGSGAIDGKDPLHASSTQRRLRQTCEILKRIEPWAGSISAAWSWYRSYPIASLGDLTAEALVSRGRAEDALLYLSQIGEGGYA